jgi:hypothetical protein
MAIFTPTGLKIRLPVAYAFALIGRLHPRVTAFKMLKTAEGIQLLPSVYFSIAVLLCLILDVRPLHIGLIGAGIYGINSWIRNSPVFMPGEIAVGTLYSYISFWGIPFILLVALAFCTGGWKASLAVVLGRGIGELLALQGDMLHARKMTKQIGRPLMSSEMSFLFAYQIHASRLGATTDIGVTDEETDEHHWQPAFYELAAKWPKVVARFTQD